MTLCLSSVCLRERQRNGLHAAVEGVASADTTRFFFVLVLHPELFQGRILILFFCFLLLLILVSHLYIAPNDWF